MLKSSQAFSNFEELKENVDGNRIQTIRLPVDMENNNPVELERPVIGATSKISSLQLARQAVKKKQFDIAKIHFGMILVLKKFWFKNIFALSFEPKISRSTKMIFLIL